MKTIDSSRRVKIYVVGVSGGWLEVERFENLTIDEAAEAVKKAYADYDDPIVKVY